MGDVSAMYGCGLLGWLDKMKSQNDQVKMKWIFKWPSQIEKWKILTKLKGSLGNFIGGYPL